MSLLDDFLGGYATILKDGVASVARKTIEIVGADVADDPVNKRTVITVAGGGGGGGNILLPEYTESSAGVPIVTETETELIDIDVDVPADTGVIVFAYIAFENGPTAVGQISGSIYCDDTPIENLGDFGPTLLQGDPYHTSVSLFVPHQPGEGEFNYSIKCDDSTIVEPGEVTAYRVKLMIVFTDAA